MVVIDRFHCINRSLHSKLPAIRAVQILWNSLPTEMSIGRITGGCVLTLYMPIFLRRNINMCLQFIYFLHTDMTWQIIESNYSSCNTITCLFCVVNIMAANGLTTQGASTSATIILSQLNRDNSVLIQVLSNKIVVISRHAEKVNRQTRYMSYMETIESDGQADGQTDKQTEMQTRVKHNLRRLADVTAW